MAKKGSILLNLAGLEPQKIRNIVKCLSDLDQIFKVTPAGLNTFSFLNCRDSDKILTLRNSKVLEQELKLIEKNKIRVIDIFDSDYPYLLKQIAWPPLVLYTKGDIGCFAKEAIALVGTRRPTGYGRRISFDFARKLSSLGVTVVSGLAKGIDTAAHKGALAAGGSTLAVLGSGLERIYPFENKKLALQIMNSGLVISEYPIQTAPLAKNFPRRNRIISGLAKGIVVTEAARRSGALITANFALSQNREVFAVPGPIDQEVSQGPNALIKEGAKLTSSIEDILEEINLTSKEIAN